MQMRQEIFVRGYQQQRFYRGSSGSIFAAKGWRRAEALEKKQTEAGIIKIFDALYAADQRLGTEAAEQKLTEFALSYVDVKAYKEEILKQQPDLNEDRAYRQALAQAKEEAKAYTERFKGLDEKLSIAWDRDPSGADRDKRPFSAAHGMGKMIILIPLSCSLTGNM